MTTTLKTKEEDPNPEEILDYLASLSNNNTNKIKYLFAKFEISTGFNAHQNLINEILSVCAHHHNKRLFSSLEIYQQLLQDFQPYAESDLEPVAGQGKWNNPVKYVSRRPLAALILMDKSHKDTRLDPIYVLTQLIIFSIHSNIEKSSKSLKHVINAANEVRSLLESENPITLLTNFSESIKDIYYINELIELIKYDQDIRSNSKAISIFSAISKILPLIPTKGIAHFRVSRPSPLQDPADVTNTLYRSPVIFSSENSSSEEPEEECLVFVTDSTDDIHDIDEEKIAPEFIENLPSSDLEELSTTLKGTKLDTEKYLSTKLPIAYLDNDFSQYSRNLHNQIERKWLSDALKEPEKLDSDTITSLCISLSICTSINHIDLLDQSISENGLITPDGYFCRQIPDTPNAIKPEGKAKELYTEHINDQTQPYVYLPLPEIVKAQINKIPAKQIEKSKTIRDLFDPKDKDPAEKIKGLIQRLNNKYGQRFNTNRISCQLKQFIKSVENDPCITYAIFGRTDQKAPTAFYYRSITLGRLVSIYESLSERYFNEK